MSGQKTDARDHRLGQRLKEARKRADLTQRQVAAKFRMSPTQVLKYEKGVNRISAIHLDILSQLTGTPITEFLAAIAEAEKMISDGLAEPAQASLVEDDEWSELAGVVARHVRDNFSDESRKEFIGAIDALRRELKGTKKANRG